MSRRLVLVVNPGARGAPGSDVGRAAEIAASSGWEARVEQTDMRGHAFILAQETAAQGADMVVAVGGDGTVREVAAGLAETGVPMAIVPSGSGNSSYLELFGTAPWEKTLEAVLAARRAPRAVDLIQLHPTGEYALLGFSAGWFAQVVELAARSAASGAARYVEAAGNAAKEPAHFPATVSADGVAVANGELGLVAIGGARIRASLFPVFPGSSMDDGLLELLVVRDTDTAGFNDLLGAVMTGSHLDHPLTEYRRARSIEITAPNGMPAEVDGDLWGRDIYSLEVTCAPGALLVATARGRQPGT